MALKKEATAEIPNAAKEVVQEKPKYSKEELMAIFDTILFEGAYSETVAIKGKLQVTFTTRSTAATSAITKELDSKQFNLMSSMQEYRAFLAICHSLTGYHGKDISTGSLDDRKSFVEKLPSVVVAALSYALVEFDSKTAAALDENENF